MEKYIIRTSGNYSSPYLLHSLPASHWDSRGTTHPCDKEECVHKDVPVPHHGCSLSQHCSPSLPTRDRLTVKAITSLPYKEYTASTCELDRLKFQFCQSPKMGRVSIKYLILLSALHMHIYTFNMTYPLISLSCISSIAVCLLRNFSSVHIHDLLVTKCFNLTIICRKVFG